MLPALRSCFAGAALPEHGAAAVTPAVMASATSGRAMTAPLLRIGAPIAEVSSGARDDPVHAVVAQRGDVQLAARADPERARAGDGQPRAAIAAGAGRARDQAADVPV